MQLTCPRSKPGIQIGAWSPWIQTLNRSAVCAQEPWQLEREAHLSGNTVPGQEHQTKKFQVGAP